MKQAEILDNIIELIPNIPEYLAPSTELHKFLKNISAIEVKRLFSEEQAEVIFNKFGNIKLPYYRMGNIDSLNLFNFDEIVIFSFYDRNRDNYKNVLDIGGNIGLHSIVMGKCGFNVVTYEPDAEHFQRLIENVSINNLSDSIKLIKAAVSSSKGEARFTRVLGNTTGSHLTGAKDNLYGDLEEIVVQTESITEILDNQHFDFIKIDAEGHEYEILSNIPISRYSNFDVMVEVGNEKNAKKIFDYFNNSGINLIAQKIGFRVIENLEQMPCSHRDGSLFISRKNYVPGITANEN